MRMITLLNHCHHFPGFVYEYAIFDRFEKALDRAGEKMWRLPLDDEYREIIRSGIADIMNSGGRWG